MELAFLTLLLKDGADSVSGGVAINDKGVLETGLSKDRGGTYGINECLEGRFMFIFPTEFATLGAECDEGIERGGQKTKVPDVHAIKIEETQEGTQFAKGRGSFPVFDTINFDGVHGDADFTDDNT